MALALANFLKERYLNITDLDLGSAMSTAYDEYINNTLVTTAEEYYETFQTETLFKNGLCLPSGSNLSVHDKERIKECLNNYF